MEPVAYGGAPGWLRGGKNGVSGGQSGTERSELIIYGDVRLTVRFDSAKQLAVINDRTIDVAGDNVVFVDGVDSPAPLRMVRTSSVNRAMPGSAGQIGVVLKTSPEIMSFLRCDAPVREHPQREYLERLCLETIGVPK